MKRVEMEQVFSPRMGWDRDCIGSYEDGQWGEYVDGDKPAGGKPLPEGSVTIKGGFRSAQSAVAVKDGRAVAIAVASECTWWDDPDTCATYAPEDGETLHTFCWRTESDPISDASEEDAVSSDPERRGTWELWSLKGIKMLPAWRLRKIGAWRDADDRHAEAVKEIKAAKKAAYDRLVAEARYVG